MWPLERTQAKKLTTHDGRRTIDNGRRTQHYQNSSGELKITEHKYSKTCLQRPSKGSNKSGLLQ